MAKLKKGDTVHIKNRLYGIVDWEGLLCFANFGQEVAIYPTRREARECCDKDRGERVIRLADVSGTIV